MIPVTVVDIVVATEVVAALAVARRESWLFRGVNGVASFYPFSFGRYLIRTMDARYILPFIVTTGEGWRGELTWLVVVSG